MGLRQERSPNEYVRVNSHEQGPCCSLGRVSVFAVSGSKFLLTACAGDSAVSGRPHTATDPMDCRYLFARPAMGPPRRTACTTGLGIDQYHSGVSRVILLRSVRVDFWYPVILNPIARIGQTDRIP